MSERHDDTASEGHAASLRRIERTHAVLGGVWIAGAVLVSGPRAAFSVAAGWLVMSLSLWMWKRITTRMLFGGPTAAGRASLGMLGKMLATFGGVFALFRYLDTEAVPFVAGTLALPVACVAVVLRGHHEPLAHAV